MLASGELPPFVSLGCKHKLSNCQQLENLTLSWRTSLSLLKRGKEFAWQKARVRLGAKVLGYGVISNNRRCRLFWIQLLTFIHVHFNPFGF